MTKASRGGKAEKMVGHLIKFRPSEWEEIEAAAAVAKSDNVSAFVRIAIREKIARESRPTDKKKR